MAPSQTVRACCGGGRCWPGNHCSQCNKRQADGDGNGSPNAAPKCCVAAGEVLAGPRKPRSKGRAENHGPETEKGVETASCINHPERSPDPPAKATAMASPVYLPDMLMLPGAPEARLNCSPEVGLFGGEPLLGTVCSILATMLQGHPMPLHGLSA